MLEPGQVQSLREIAWREGVDSGYVSRMVNLTTLAPDIVAAVLFVAMHPEDSMSANIGRSRQRAYTHER